MRTSLWSWERSSTDNAPLAVKDASGWEGNDSGGFLGRLVVHVLDWRVVWEEKRGFLERKFGITVSRVIVTLIP